LRRLGRSGTIIGQGLFFLFFRWIGRLLPELGPRAMVKPHLINDPKHWRERAEEARTVAEALDDPEAKRMMFEIARGYERLAQRAEERLKWN
jgi:hypothetical protein